MAKGHQEIDTSDGTPTKADNRRLKKEMRERDVPSDLDKAYQEGWEAGNSPGDGDGGKGGSGSRSSSGVSLPSFSFKSDAQKIIVISMTITGIVAIVEKIHDPGASGDKGVPIPSIIVGTFVSGTILIGASYFAPEFASGLAVVAMIATVLERGKPFWELIGAVTGKAPDISGGDSSSIVITPVGTIGPIVQAAPGSAKVSIGPGSDQLPNTGPGASVTIGEAHQGAYQGQSSNNPYVLDR